MNKIFKNKKLFILVAVFIFIVSFGSTYAYFGFTTRTAAGPNNIITESGTLTIAYTDGPQLSLTRAKPSATISKTISVENTGSLPATYNIRWATLTNQILYNELLISSTCTQTRSGATSGTCTGISSAAIPTTAGNIKTNISIGAGYKQTYVITITFKETGSNQNYNQGKSFAGTINAVATS